MKNNSIKIATSNTHTQHLPTMAEENPVSVHDVETAGGRKPAPRRPRSNSNGNKAALQQRRSQTWLVLWLLLFATALLGLAGPFLLSSPTSTMTLEDDDNGATMMKTTPLDRIIQQLLRHGRTDQSFSSSSSSPSSSSSSSPSKSGSSSSSSSDEVEAANLNTFGNGNDDDSFKEFSEEEEEEEKRPEPRNSVDAYRVEEHILFAMENEEESPDDEFLDQEISIFDKMRRR